jgi:site-specific DNA-cytosine methylase
MTRPLRVLDLFCCGGGAARGYAQAGFDVVGVDIKQQPEYPYEFHRADAVEFLLAHGQGFDLVHASPPCQGYSKHVSGTGQWDRTQGKLEPRLIEATRAAAIAVRRPYIIENVVGAREHMRAPLELCGTMFGLPIPRHRLFESSLPLIAPHHRECKGVAKAYAERRGWEYRDMTVTGKGRHKGTADRWKEIMGIPLHEAMTQHQLRESIPPAYTRFLGAQAYLLLAGAANEQIDLLEAA